MIEFKEVRKSFLGDKRLAQLYLHEARVLLGSLKADMAHNGLAQGVRRAVIPVNHRIDLGPFRSTGPGGGDSEETSERRLTGKVALYAASNHGLDEVWIDASSVTLKEHTVTTSRGGEYHPYLWVGVRELSGGSGERGEAFGDKSGPDLVLNFCVFEPEATRPTQTVTVFGAHDYVFDSIELPNNGTFSDLVLKDELWVASSGSYAGPDLVWTDRGLYLANFGVASPLSPGYPDTLWQICAILDPNQRQLEVKKLGPFVFGGVQYDPSPGSFGPIPLQSKVLGGNYVVKLMGTGIDCEKSWPITYELKAIVGKAPGRITTHSTTFTISHGSGFFADWYPGGYHYAADAQGLYGFGNNRHDPKCWWPGALRIDVQNGFIMEEEDYYPQPKDKPDVWFNPREGLIEDCTTNPKCFPLDAPYFVEIKPKTDNPFYNYDQETPPYPNATGPHPPHNRIYPKRPPYYLWLTRAKVLRVTVDGLICEVQMVSECNEPKTAPGWPFPISTSGNANPAGHGEVWKATGSLGETYAYGDNVYVVQFFSLGDIFDAALHVDKECPAGGAPDASGLCNLVMEMCPCARISPHLVEYDTKLYLDYPKAMVDNWLANNRCP